MAAPDQLQIDQLTAELRARLQDPTIDPAERREAQSLLDQIQPPGAGARAPGATPAPMPGMPSPQPQPITPTTPGVPGLVAEPTRGEPLAPPPALPFGAGPPAPPPGLPTQEPRPFESTAPGQLPPPIDPLLDPNNPWNLGGSPGNLGLGVPDPTQPGFAPPGPGRPPEPPAPIPPAPMAPLPPDLYANYPMAPGGGPAAPGAPPGAPPGGTNVFGPGQTGVPFQRPGAPPMPPPPGGGGGGGGGGGVDFAGMNAPSAFGFGMPPSEPLTPAPTDPDRQRRMDLGDDLMTLGLGILAAADGRSGLSAIGAGGLAMLASQRERDRTRSESASEAEDRAQRAREHQADRDLRVWMLQAGFQNDLALEGVREAGRMRRAMDNGDDPSEDLAESWQRHYDELLTDDSAIDTGQRDIEDQPIMRRPTPEEAARMADEYASLLARRLGVPFERTAGATGGIDPSQLVDGEEYLVTNEAGEQVRARWNAATRQFE